MEGEPITNRSFKSSVHLNGGHRPHRTIKTLLSNFILPDIDMAIKQNQTDKTVYTVPVNLSPPKTDRAKSINEAKQAFLNSTVNHSGDKPKKEEITIHYAQIAITTGSEDMRSTGGGKDRKLPYPPLHVNQTKTINNIKPIDFPPTSASSTIKKRFEQHHRKVSFKTRNASATYRRPPIASKMTISSTNVSELTKKFNNLQSESRDGIPIPTKLVKTIGDLATASRCSASNSSTPSSTLSSSPNIKIVLRHRRGSKKRNNKKRCSSVDSIDKLIVTDNSNTKISVIRSKSDGTKIPKSPKKRLKYQDSSEKQSGSDSVDGSPAKEKVVESKVEKKQPESIKVRNVIKKFEYESVVRNNSTLKRQPDRKTSTIPVKEKPKVPEKKSSLVLTKNIVVKDGVPKIKTIKPTTTSTTIEPQSKVESNNQNNNEVLVKKDPIYDRKKFKTNYIHTEKLALKVVEIIPEDVNESNNLIDSTDQVEEVTESPSKLDDSNETNQVNSIIPNDSFLWRRKNSIQIYIDPEKHSSDNTHSFMTMTSESHDNEQQIVIRDESKGLENNESQEENAKKERNSDFETNLVEAYNKEVLVGYTTKPQVDENPEENDYEPLEPKDDNHVVIIPVKPLDHSSKVNCPLPEIPKCSTKLETSSSAKENIYQTLLEMRSHPEGDESSLHNYELCENVLEERTRGDGDSDDGYEYCKTPIKPYCVTSSSGIQIAENYKPPKNNNTNYTITKSVSGASTGSYEKIGSERIYEKIPYRSPKSKDSSPTYSSRHSFVSDYNDNENIYDTIKQSDGVSLSHCYESIPNSPNTVKLRTNLKKQLNSAQKRLSFDTVSNISQSTVSSEVKTNSIYGQRSVISYNGQEIAFQVPSSETSVSDRSDRSDDWVDVSDEEKTYEQKIIIVRERSRGRKSPISWSQKVRHQWQKLPPQKTEDKVSVTSPSHVYLDTTVKSPYYSRNDEEARRTSRRRTDADGSVVFVQVLEQRCWLSIRTVLRDDDIEIQDIAAYLECESSDSGHLYESLDLRPPPHDDSDSFDSDTDTDDNDKSYAPAPPTLPASRLPTPPSGGQHTLTKIANAAQKKMKQIKRNLTKRYTVAMDGKPFTKSPPSQNGTYDIIPTTKKVPIYANLEKTEAQHLYSNINFNESAIKNETPLKNGNFKEEVKGVGTEKNYSNGDPPPLPDKPLSLVPTSPTSESKKDNSTLSRKTYFSFKSRFRRATSVAVDINDVPSALKTTSTFYLTDSMDGDSGFSNCSDNGQAGSSETLSRRRDGRRPRWAESSPCLALERPTVPPPPPPHPQPPRNSQTTDISAVNEELKRLLPTLSKKDKSPRARTSWYADCGSDVTQPSNASWYAEAGLYQAGNVSTSSGASSGSHSTSPLPHSLFTHEPLYQFYNAAKVESVCRETGDSDSESYERAAAAPARPSAMALVAPRGPARTLWCEVPEVVNSAVLSSLVPAQKRLQEAKFELLTSEASYLNSLNVLEAHFIAHPAFREAHIMPREDWNTLFSTILPVRKCSQLLMNELEKCWQENILLTGICDIVRRHAEEHFHVYVKYCENQVLMVKALQRLREQPAFAAALKRMENHPACQSLSLHSFLLLPMQRVTRLPLLLDAVLRHLAPQDPEYQAAGHALATLNDFVSQCNEGARNTERVEEMSRLARCIEFPAHIRAPPALAPAAPRPARYLVRSGDLTQLVWKTDEIKLTFGKKFHKVPLCVFLFNDHLVIAKKKGEDQYIAVDHCPRSLLEVCGSDGGAASAKHALLLTLLENHEGRTVELLLSCPSETDASRWAEALSVSGAADTGEAVYAGWDCPQVCALYAYSPAQPDELPLDEGDVVNVTRKTTEGWYYGERTRDGEQGWFPGAYTAEIASAHVRARNLRQRYRLLALSGTYFGQRKKL